MMTRPGRDARGASVVEYVLLIAMVALVVFATVYALGRSSDRPASVLGDTFNNPPVGNPVATGPVSSSSTTSSSTTTTTSTELPPLPS
jgi:Flp pilus assembly pilin Flp